MSALLGLIMFITFLGVPAFLITALICRIRNKPAKVWLKRAGICFLIAIAVSILSPSKKNTDDTAEKKAASEETAVQGDTSETAVPDEDSISQKEDSPEDEHVDGESLISAVREVTNGTVAKDESISDVTFDNGNLTVLVDLSEADTSVVPLNELSVARISSITDAILSMDQKYYDAWDTITIAFDNGDSATFDKSKVADDGAGKYFKLSDNCLEIGANWTAEQRNAYNAGKQYLAYSAFSKQGLIDQLSSEVADNYPVDAAEFAVDQIERRGEVDWYEQAERAAREYLDYTSFSKQGLIDQLSSEYGSKFTQEQAEQAVENVYDE